VVGAGTDDADVEPVSLIPAGKSVDHVDAASGIKVVDGALSIDAPDLRTPVGGLETESGRVEGDMENQNTSGLMGLLTGPHQILPCEVSSFTIRLSSGDLPVLAPEYAVMAPDKTIAVPVS
jgi:hypothetical protein